MSENNSAGPATKALLPGGGGGGVNLIFSYIHRLGSFLGVQNFEFHHLGGGGGIRKMNIFWGLRILWIFLWGHHKKGLYLGVISIHFRVFS